MEFWILWKNDKNSLTPLAHSIYCAGSCYSSSWHQTSRHPHRAAHLGGMVPSNTATPPRTLTLTQQWPTPRRCNGCRGKLNEWDILEICCYAVLGKTFREVPFLDLISILYHISSFRQYDQTSLSIQSNVEKAECLCLQTRMYLLRVACLAWCSFSAF